VTATVTHHHRVKVIRRQDWLCSI